MPFRLYQGRLVGRNASKKAAVLLTDTPIRSIAEAGETGILFLDKIIAPAPTTQATSWLNVGSLAYP